MKPCIFTTALKELPFEEMLKKVAELGVDTVEIGCGEESGFFHCPSAELLTDENKYNEYVGLLDKYGIKVSAFATHGNPISPNKHQRELSVTSMKNAVLLAEKMGVDKIVAFTGLPGDGPEATKLNWVTVSDSQEFRELYKWQWENELIPFWKDFVAFCREHNMHKIAIELHPGNMCFNPKTIKRLRAEVGEEIGVNLDLSHLMWQGIDPILVIKELDGMIYHFHAKDVGIDVPLTKENGLVNTAYFHDIKGRSWNFRTIGMAHGVEFWRNVFAEIRKAGYDGVASIEMECEVMDMEDGLKKAVCFLKENLIADEVEENVSFHKRVQRGWKKHLREMEEELQEYDN